MYVKSQNQLRHKVSISSRNLGLENENYPNINKLKTVPPHLSSKMIKTEI